MKSVLKLSVFAAWIFMLIKTSQEALLGDRTPEDVAKEWADYMTKAQQKHLKK